MKSIWKFPLGDSTHPTLTMPVGAEILSVQVQHGKPQLWALVDPDAPKEVRSFYVYGTGWDVEQNTLRFIGTVQMQGGVVRFPCV
jgi:hypothetical protein